MSKGQFLSRRAIIAYRLAKHLSGLLTEKVKRFDRPPCNLAAVGSVRNHLNHFDAPFTSDRVGMMGRRSGMSVARINDRQIMTF
jgi:hypothetical protein